MRLLLLSEYFPNSGSAEFRGGVESRCFSVARELAKRHDVTVITSYSGGPRMEEFEGILVERVGKQHAYSHSGSVGSRFSFAREAVKTGKRLERADIVDGYNFLSYLPAHTIASHHRTKCVATYHDVWIGGEWHRLKGLLTGTLGELWERMVLANVWDKFIAVSSFTKSKLTRHGIPGTKVEVIPNGINLARFKAVKRTRSAHPSVCCVSRLVPYKQVDMLIRAMSIIAKEVPDASCSVIGTGPERSSLETLVKELGLTKHVRFLGFLERHEDVIREMKSAWTFAFPSSVEGFGMVAVEAMACGTPHVSSNIPPIAEATGNGKGGFLFDTGDVVALAEHLIQLLQDRKLRAKKAKEGKKHAKQFDWPIIVKQIERVYEGLLS